MLQIGGVGTCPCGGDAGSTNAEIDQYHAHTTRNLLVGPRIDALATKSHTLELLDLTCGE
jgi:hypothetical protein